MEQNKRVIILGAGFSSLSASCYLAKAGYDVTILEKNESVGGRASQLKRDGFTFDMGPTFYWMPDVFENFFKDFGQNIDQAYDLIRLDPSYSVCFGHDDFFTLSANGDEISAAFEAVEPGSGARLNQFLNKAKSNYDIAVKDLVFQPGEKIWEIVTPETIKRLGTFTKSIKQDVATYVKHPKLQKILEFPVLFLGAKPSTTPAFYNFMNYADFSLGTWYPKGGMYEVAAAMKRLAVSLGVKIELNTPVGEVVIQEGVVKKVLAGHQSFDCDILLSGADYEHTEQLLPKPYRQYSPNYWNKKTFAPSALLFYVGFDKKLDNLAHHTLFFDVDFDNHAAAIYDAPKYPEEPLFYASFPSMSDDTVAPAGKEAGIFLIPLAPGLEDNESIRQHYFDIIIQRLEQNTKQKLGSHVLFKESFSVSDFISRYNSYKGNAYGLANTLLQTHVLRPKLRSRKVKNLFFTGQLTVPGPGVPPSLISGKIVSKLIQKFHAL
ncbi:phytoene desaturase [Carboxylicivirga mesophila]|uniref:Phytoene desaturase n=1 Tax=Carboxylicivirga mesophila TaxID=1166478 RepID=A0ABS5K4Y5_9BACT|nr:phytoene desaturase family protein [Carboxylicivirga mesophila]MBS2210069.1 phytoene desaturase [Carboxylicivirga mesophila]